MHCVFFITILSLIHPRSNYHEHIGNKTSIHAVANSYLFWGGELLVAIVVVWRQYYICLSSQSCHALWL